MREVFLDGDSRFWCAVDVRAGSATRGSVIGIVGGQALEADPFKTWPGRVIELRRMSVSSSARGLGVATALVEVLETHSRACGIGRVVLSTGSVMKPAQRLYTRCGYVEARVVQFVMPEFGHTEADDVGYVVYSKEV